MAAATDMSELKLGVNALRVLEERYLQKGENGRVSETPLQMFMRVARHVAKAGRGGRKTGEYWKVFFDSMRKAEFLPNTPCLMNAGTPIGQLAACFVIGVPDSMEGIFDAVKLAAIVQKSGGGTGFSFSSLRPEGDVVRSTMGVASGPVSFMRVFNMATEVTKQGGKRRGANMGVLRADHPDILKFISAKSREGSLGNFNISVGVTDEFMRAAVNNRDYTLVNPRTGRPSGRLNAGRVFGMIVRNAWKTGDPGIIFLDEINRKNPLPELGELEATNPCGEQPLYPFESCNLGSINLKCVVKGRKVDWKKLKRLARLGVRFLDNVIDCSKYPDKRIEAATKANRKIGLGVMGFAEMLILLGIPYNSAKGLKMAEKIMGVVSAEGRKESARLGRERGSFPNFRKSIWAKKYRHMRNATVTTIAPTGTISIIAGCSSGIEPLFAVSFVRNVMGGKKLLETNPEFEEAAKEEGIYSRSLMREIAKTGSIQSIKGIPHRMKKVFVAAMDMGPSWHVRMQAAFQRHTDNAVSKTINLPRHASPDDVRKAFLLAWKMKCKGITVFRYGSRRSQVLTFGGALTAEPEYSGGCPASPYCAP
jgi:ribonucleoside-diphosphate reductase alpha chain